MLHPLLEARNPRFGDIPLHPDSIIFLSSNLASDGVQDDIRAHTRNRVTSIHVSKPDATQWLNWAARNNIEPTVMAWVDRNPHALASYLDAGQSSNPFIFNPKTTHAKGAFVSPRSLQRASEILANRNRISTRDAMRAALAGTVGAPAAADMEVFVNYQDKLPSFVDIIGAPKTTTVPDNPGLCSILIYGAVQRVDSSDTLDKFMTYLSRMPTEWGPVFVKMFMSIPERVTLTVKSSNFRDWCIANADIIG
jgi:hypothetical protein